MISFLFRWHVPASLHMRSASAWFGINSQLFLGGGSCLTLSNMILLIIMSFSSINILIWKQRHDFRFYLYLRALETQSHEKSLSPLNTILDVTFLGLLVFGKIFLAFAFRNCFHHTNPSVVSIFRHVLLKSCEKCFLSQHVGFC